MTVEERVIKLENAFSTLAQLAARSDSRTSENEQSLRTLVELARVQSERLDESNERLAAIESNLVALSQIVVELGQAQRRADERMAQMDERLDRLAALVERHVSGGDVG